MLPAMSFAPCVRLFGGSVVGLCRYSVTAGSVPPDAGMIEAGRVLPAFVASRFEIVFIQSRPPETAAHAFERHSPVASMNATRLRAQNAYATALSHCSDSHSRGSLLQSGTRRNARAGAVP